jgi:Xaa-Pro dipeptidase
VLLAPHTRLPFTGQELSSRLSRTCAGMDALGIDVALVTDQDDIFYLTGGRRLGGLTHCALLVARGELLFVARQAEAEAFVSHTGLPARGYSDGDEPEEAIARAVVALGGPSAPVGAQVGSPSLPVARLRRLHELLPEAEWRDGTRLVWDQRAVKSPPELALMREAARINARALDRAVRAIRPGATDSEVASELFTGMLEAGSDEVGYFVVASGEHTGVVHAPCEQRELRADDHVHVELSAARFRYHAPLVRTVTIGRPSAVVERLHAGAEAGLHAALGAIRAGVTSHEVDAAASAAVEELGLRRLDAHRTGYSVGIATGNAGPEGHIATVRARDGTILRENMTFHLPLVLVEPGVAGAGLSETVRVTETGIELLTSYPQELLRL